VGSVGSAVHECAEVLNADLESTSQIRRGSAIGGERRELVDCRDIRNFYSTSSTTNLLHFKTASEDVKSYLFEIL
jgi:hypothetical protein